MDARRVDEASEPSVDAVAGRQVDGQRQQQLAADHLVAVHVGHVLELGLARLVPARLVRHLQHVELAALRAPTHRVQPATE